jgi:serine/threonine protein kinase
MRPPETARVPDLSATSLIPDSAMLTVAPVTLGDYEVLMELGRGAMGIVYKARQKSLGRLVAFKMVLNAQIHPTSLERFKLEARSAAALDHPGIVPLFDQGEVEGQPYYTMAFVEGDSLSGMVKKQGPLPPRRAALLLSQVADAVAYAHERGIIHRDLKPDNVLVDRQGHPRITDFGLARRLEDSPNLTAAGSIMGTPSYMAPEQAQGVSELTPAVDVYALGAMLHAVLVGQSPFSGGSVYEVLLKVTQEPPPPLRQINPALPEALERIVLRCLEKNPLQRYSSAAALADDLRAWLDSLGKGDYATAPVTQNDISLPTGQASAMPQGSQLTPTAEIPAPGRPRSRKRRVLVVAGALLVFAIGLGVVGWRLRGSKGDDTAWEKPVRQDFELKVSLPGLSPDSKGIYPVKANGKVSFVIESPHDVHVGIWSLQADGVQQLFPNEDEKDTLIRAGKSRVIPGNNLYTIEFTPADQVEFFRIVATTAKWQPMKSQRTADGPFAFFKRGQDEYDRWEAQQAELTGRGAKIRRVKQADSTSKSQQTESLVSEVVLSYRVK